RHRPRGPRLPRAPVRRRRVPLHHAVYGLARRDPGSPRGRLVAPLEARRARREGGGGGVALDQSSAGSGRRSEEDKSRSLTPMTVAATSYSSQPSLRSSE